MENTVVNIVLFFLVIYVGMVMYVYADQDNIMFHPDKVKIESVIDGNEDYQLLEIQTTDAKKLNAAYKEPESDDKLVIVYFQGNAGNFSSRIDKARALTKEGHGFLYVGYRGYNGHLDYDGRPAKPSEKGLYEDARAHINYLIKTKQIDPDRMVLYGESLGSAIATQMATEYIVAGMVIESGFESALAIANQRYFFLPVEMLMRNQFLSADKIDKNEASILFIHGEEDKGIPVSSARALYKAAHYPKSFVTIPDAGHNDLYKHGAALHVIKFLRTL